MAIFELQISESLFHYVHFLSLKMIIGKMVKQRWCISQFLEILSRSIQIVDNYPINLN